MGMSMGFCWGEGIGETFVESLLEILLENHLFFFMHERGGKVQGTFAHSILRTSKERERERERERALNGQETLVEIAREEEVSCR